ncbi:MAG: chromosome segregation protein SMC [Candidatus Woesearchaeota archaeon]
MTKILKLELDGFKSFAHKTSFHFSPGFNIIIGANGSGKSNVLDAICFVLGKSSMKDIRAETAKNLIYNGGQSKKPAKVASVSIYLDNSKNEIPINSEVVKITRIVNDEGISTYKINDKKSTRREIVELLNTIHVNPDGYNIILQGDIERIIEMSPIERRQIIEELAGIRIYEEKKEKAINELQKVEETLKNADIIINERSERLHNLEVEREQALKYLSLEKELKIINASLIRNELLDLEKKLSKVNQKIQTLTEKIKQNEEEIRKLKLERDQYYTQINEITSEIERKSNFQDSELRKLLDEKKIEIEKNKIQLENYQKEINKIKIKINQLQTSVKDLNSKIKVNESELSNLRKELSNKEKEKEEIEKDIEKIRKDLRLDELKDVETEMEKIEKDIEKAETEVNELKTKQMELLRKKDKIEFELENIKSRMEKIEEEKKNAQKILNELNAKKEKFREITLKLNEKLNLDSKYSKEISNARENLIKTENELKKLKSKENERLNQLRNLRTIKFIEDLKKEIPGIIGFVYELISVENKYSLAVEIAAGNRLNGIVVENEDVALKIIERLKKEKIGNAMFFPLNKIKPQSKVNVEQYKKIPGVIDLIENVISCDPELKNVISYVFSNTLLIEKPEVAKKVGIGNIRMITLEGDLFETSGVIHGGFFQKQTVGLMSKEEKETLEKLEKDFENYQIILAELDKKKQENLNEIYELRKEKGEIEAEIIKLEKALPKIEILDDTTLKEQAKQTNSELETLNSVLIKKLQELAQLKSQRQKLRESIAKARSPEVMAQLNSFQEKRNQIIQNITQLQSEIKNLEKNLKEYLLVELEETKKLIEEEEKNEKKLSTEITQINELLIKGEKELKELKEKEENIYIEFKELFQKRKDLEDLTKEIEIKIIEKESEIRELENEINLIETNASEDKIRHESLKQQLLEFGVDEFYDMSKSTLKEKEKVCKDELEKLGQVNLKSIEEYEELKKNVDELLRKKQELENEKKEILILMNEIETKKKEEFLKYFNSLRNIFSQKFQELVEKGEATLELESPETIFDKGVKIVVKLNKNRFLDIKSLSGGEKAITALAFIFSLQEIQPAPFYVFDEVDAPLDKRNSERLAQYIKKYSKEAQFIIISHNDAVIAEGDTIYGISMNKKEAISTAVALRFEDYIKNGNKEKNVT